MKTERKDNKYLFKILTLIIAMSLTLVSNKGIAQEQNRKVGIFLSGGGALGFAHIGILQALEEEGIYPEYIAGASMGALVGSFYASGKSPG